MAENGWKDKVGGVPLFGRLLAALRGWWTLPVWRQALRNDVHQLRLELDRCRDRQADWQNRLAEALPRQDADHWIATEVRARWVETENSLAGFQGQLQRLFQDDARGRLMAEHRLQELERKLMGLQEAWSANVPHEPPMAGLGAKPLPTGPRPWPGVPSLVPATHDLERWREPLRARLAAVPRTSPWCDLSDQPPERWAELLNDLAPASQAAIVAAEGAASFDRGQQSTLLSLARTRLHPGGWVALGYPNPENLAVLLEQSRDPRPGLLGPEAVRALFTATGHTGLDTCRCDAPMPPVGDGAEEPAALQLAWSLPRRFWVVGHRPEA